jgi:hypothetical protein
VLRRRRIWRSLRGGDRLELERCWGGCKWWGDWGWRLGLEVQHGCCISWERCMVSVWGIPKTFETFQMSVRKPWNDMLVKGVVSRRR